MNPDFLLINHLGKNARFEKILAGFECMKINLCNKKSHAIQALPAYWSEKVPKMWTLEIQGIFCPSLCDLQLILEIPGNLPINYDNLPIIYRLPIN